MNDAEAKTARDTLERLRPLARHLEELTARVYPKVAPLYEDLKRGREATIAIARELADEALEEEAKAVSPEVRSRLLEARELNAQAGDSFVKTAGALSELAQVLQGAEGVALRRVCVLEFHLAEHDQDQDEETPAEDAPE